MRNIAILASGNGTNFSAIAKAVKHGYIKANLKLMVTDKQNSYVRIRAKRSGVKNIFCDPKAFSCRLAFDKELYGILNKEKIDLVILAGFMRILTPYFVRKFKNRILNIHPALLPAFRGEHAIGRVFKSGCKITGVTVHFVDEKVDHGPVILQEKVKVKKDMSLEDLEREIHKVEHKLYPQAIKLVIDKKIKFSGRKVKVIV